MAVGYLALLRTRTLLAQVFALDVQLTYSQPALFLVALSYIYPDITW